MMLGRMAAWGLGGLGALLVLSSAVSAQSTHALVVSGVSGEPRIAQQFAHDVGLIRDALQKRFGTAAIVLTETSTPRSEKVAIVDAVKKLASLSKAGEQVLVVLIGHGSASNGDARFNIPGPDITADELSRALEELQGREVAVVVATSASGAFISPLNGAGRTIVTATKTGAQTEEVIFPQHFAKALSEDVADINKDGAISLTEAVEYTKREVARFYQQQNRLATEQATVNGANADGFVLRASNAKSSNPALTALYAKREMIQMRIAQLRDKRGSMRPDVYENELGKMLVDLAQVDRQIRAAEGK